jgi:hypothetical protein
MRAGFIRTEVKIAGRVDVAGDSRRAGRCRLARPGSSELPPVSMPRDSNGAALRAVPGTLTRSRPFVHRNPLPRTIIPE